MRWWGLKSLEVALHDIDEEADGVFTVGGFQLDDVCQFVAQTGFGGSAGDGARTPADWETD